MRVDGRLRVPGDKSISHRALILAALAGQGRSRVTGILESADVRSTAGVLRALGHPIPALSDDMVVKGGGRRVRAPSTPLDCGNSGTTARLMAGVVAGAPITARFVGDASLSRRPMRRIATPLEAMGAVVELSPGGGLPMTIHGGALRTLEWASEVASAQVKSAILLAAVMAGVPVVVDEPRPTRDHTERMLKARGVEVRVDGSRIAAAGGAELRPMDVDVPGDPSSASFFAALAAMATDGELVIDDVCVNATRTGFLDALITMGAVVEYDRQTEIGGEWVSPVVVQPGRLNGITVTDSDIPSMIDELPLLACVAARATGATVITGASELRVKESDRIAAVVSNLRAVGVDATELPDGMRIAGSDRRLTGRVTTHGDHRIAMAFGILGALPGNAIAIDDPSCVDISYPAFWEDLHRVAGGGR
ncbi:MAG TPA: 3-phosphoshikimate 1-carboxyvinyltransferase [Gemmatimonadaceae bacterium]|nr:3-phosphoshikimate 1-carboxyvinyltransferase [Gemmatimonadaceae bacterium]